MNGGNSSDSEEEEDEDAAMTEVRFVPSDPSSLDHMYKALNECQVLHPDPEDQPSDDGKLAVRKKGVKCRLC